MAGLEIIDLIYKGIITLANVGVLTILSRIMIDIGKWKQWMLNMDKEVSGHALLLHELTASVNRLVGRLENFQKRR